MRVHWFFALAACGLWISATLALAEGPGTKVNVNRGGVQVETGTKAKHDTAMHDADTAMHETHGSIVRVRDLTGLDVYNDANEKLGDIEDLVIDASTGKIRYAVLSFGGFLGLGDKYFAVPWNKLNFVAKGETREGTVKDSYCILNVSKESLKNAPGFDKSNWPNFADTRWNMTIERHYGTQREASGERLPKR